jgi:hypothetical protein
MQRSLNYASEKLCDAVRALAILNGDIRERLYYAYAPSLLSLSVLADQISDARLAKELGQIIFELKAKGTPSNHFADMTDEDAHDLAQKIVYLFKDVQTEYAREQK